LVKFSKGAVVFPTMVQVPVEPVPSQRATAPLLLPVKVPEA